MWTPVTGPEVDGLKGRFADITDDDHLKAEYFVPSFYKSGAILRMKVGEFDHMFIAVGDGEISDRDLIPVTGDANQIHGANERAGFKLENAADAESYMRFFCGSIVSRGGEFFYIIDKLSGLLSMNDFDIPVGPPVFTGVIENPVASVYFFDVFMMYEGQLFAAEMAVYTNGDVEMVEDFPLGIVVRPTMH